jgi:hypothetical protein
MQTSQAAAIAQVLNILADFYTMSGYTFHAGNTAANLRQAIPFPPSVFTLINKIQ